MAKVHVNKVFERQTVAIDGNEYIDCIFRDCVVTYAGGRGFVIDGCDFENTRGKDHATFKFIGSAGNTIAVIRALAAMSPDLKAGLRRDLGLDDSTPPAETPTGQR